MGLRSLDALLRIRRFVQNKVRIFVVLHKLAKSLKLLCVYLLYVHCDDLVFLSHAVVHIVYCLQLARVTYGQPC